MLVPLTGGRAISRLALFLLCLPFAGAAAQASLADRLEFHGSLNAGYGRAHELPVFGIPIKGTSDYRVFTLQSRFTLDGNDEIVTQIFNRRLGTSPLASAISDVTMQWAYWQHRTEHFTVKAGRSPLPRGLMNEVRYIGTVLPFFRPSMELQQDAFDAVDGAVVSYTQRLPFGLELEQHGFGGGSENRVIATTSTGPQVRIARTENMFGGQTYLSLPVAGIRFGAYGARYNYVQPTQRGYRTNVIFSGEATPIDRLHLQTEHGRIWGHGPNVDTKAGYAQAKLRLVERFSVAGEYSYQNRELFFTNAALNRFFPEVRSQGVSGIVRLTSNSMLKLEHHWRNGYQFDTPYTVIASQTPTSVTLTPAAHARYYIVSVAATF